MDNISLIPKNESGGESLPKFVSFQKSPLEFSALAKLGFGLIFLILILTGGLYFWKYRLNKQAEAFNTELQRLTGQRDMSLEARLNSLNSILEIFKGVLDDHRYFSEFFKVLEEKTLNTVTFKSLDADDAENSVALTGQAPSYGILAQQVKIFENTAGIASVAASEISLRENGKINFTLRINFAKDFIRKK